jgi:4-amino-4-deoxy-L-arabinose transferase-like glycosyltransferase
VERYTLAEQRPHWPGYPVYIGVGKLLHGALGDPVAALRVLSLAACALALWPLAFLATGVRRAAGVPANEAARAGFAASSIFALTPAAWLTGGEILSDPFALLLALCLLLLSWRLSQTGSRTPELLLAAVLAGLLPGARPTALPLVLPLVYTIFRIPAFSRGDAGPRLAVLPTAAFVAALWLGGLWIHEGTALFDTTREHLAGHYGRWGNTALQDPSPWTRPLRLLRVLIVGGLGGWWPGLPWTRLPATVGLTAFVFLGLRRIRSDATSSLGPLLLAWTLPYALWVLFGFDLDVPRYTLPLVAVTALVAGLGVPSRASVPILVALGVAQAVVTVPLAFEHARHPSLGYALADTLRIDASRTDAGNRPSALLVTDPLLFVPAPALPAGAALVYADPGALSQEARRFEARGFVVYATAPAPEASGEWTLVAHLRRSLAQSPPGPPETWLFRRASP